MTLVNKILIALCLVAIGLFGIAYYSAFAFTRTPAGNFIENIEGSGNPITIEITYQDLGGIAGGYAYCQDYQIVLERVGDNFRVYGDWETPISYWVHTNTLYGITAGYWHILLRNRVNYGGHTCIPSEYSFGTYFTFGGTLNIVYPAPDSTLEIEPNHFEISYFLGSAYATASYQYKQFIVQYGKTPTALIYGGEFARSIFSPATSSQNIYIQKLTNLNGEGYARATMLFSENGLVYDRALTSVIIHWNQPTFASVTAGEPTDFGIIGNTIRDIAIWAFIPESGSFNRFSGLLDLIKEKPPVGYFTRISDTFSSLSSGSPTISWNLTAIESITAPLKTGLTWLLWVFWAIWLLSRITKFDWHL